MQAAHLKTYTATAFAVIHAGSERVTCVSTASELMIIRPYAHAPQPRYENGK